MSTRLGKWTIARMIALALALAGFYGIKTVSTSVKEEICKAPNTERPEKMIKTAMPIFEVVARHMIRL